MHGDIAITYGRYIAHTPGDYDRWLSTIEPDPRDLLKPYPAEPTRIWPISTRVNQPRNDDAAILEPISEQLLQPRLRSPSACPRQATRVRLWASPDIRRCRRHFAF
jgi:hypothetical protein